MFAYIADFRFKIVSKNKVEEVIMIDCTWHLISQIPCAYEYGGSRSIMAYTILSQVPNKIHKSAHPPVA